MSQRRTISKGRSQVASMEIEHDPSLPKHRKMNINPKTFRKDEHGVPCLVRRHDQNETLIPLIEVMKVLKSALEDSGKDTKKADDFIHWFDQTYPLSK